MAAIYGIDIVGSGETVSVTAGASEARAICDVLNCLDARGYDRSEVAIGEWDADGRNDDGEPCYRMLFWASEADSENDAGAKSIAQLTRVGR